MDSWRVTLATAVCATTLVGGCRSTPSAQPLTPSSFYSNQNPAADPPDHPLDKPGVIDYDAPRRPEKSTPAEPLILAPKPAPVPTPAPAPATTGPTSLNGGAPVTQQYEDEGFQVVGFVVAEVNGNPIFADQVIKQLKSALAAEARKLDRDDFRKAAGELIKRQIDTLVMNELEIAAAESRLNEEEKRSADMMTMQWRLQEITRAGGSVQQALENYRSQGLEFDEEVRKQYQQNLVKVFTWRKLMPLIRVNAADMRQYYDGNANLYTQFGQATFRVIKIDPKQHGGRDAAERRAREIRQRALTEDFAELAASEANDDPIARRTGSLLKDMKKDSYVHEKVEDAVWATKPGEVTDVIADGGAFYIAKVESIQDGTVTPFGDMAVQAGIRERLMSQQFQKLRESHRQRLIQNAVIKGGTGEQLAITLDMAMQNYDQWASANSSAN
ncbi:MAG TPA: peptidyl-prolyl cis-trans isomerase [Tepidisphaeraceae bacterium]|jgi:parvulin-like peptidyl-prolyl isomerase|nr:peptidyl-prolyl cis-trans isomerase [Tepidisphaeraceae bacterium]